MIVRQAHNAVSKKIGPTVADPRHPITDSDVQRALESARIFNVPNNREVIHVVPRYYVVDGHDHVSDPVGMFGSRLDVETHVVTCSSSAMQNLVHCVEGAGVRVESLILQPLASAEAVGLFGRGAPGRGFAGGLARMRRTRRG